ncbi:hypothetical protein F2P44_25705 [Massilia sp. CCM 8695]|uniref:HTH luxR-type domain-containing protein n=1 Tax=Massilia frigida TaxID=2609281 RepID=A0ABX0NC11_9BURK|nr:MULTISPECIES: LuxR C-terminal-related transcriptional regulator [Massilia]MDM5182158.1 LuxR C-terminal-related transcriptional regulator [Massilia sp. DJPM01]NHZ82647.1 hypothetical protein [Massilia frigida]
MTSFNSELLSLYKDCRSESIDRFQIAVFERIKALVPFDSGRLIGVDTTRGGAEVRTSLNHREPEAVNVHWEEVARLDRVLSAVSNSPGIACNFNARRLFSDAEVAVVLDYTVRFRHLNGLVIATINEISGLLEGLSLYRARDDDQFTYADQRCIEGFAPHLQQALQINRALTQGAEPAFPFAIISYSGLLNFCTSQFDEYLRAEFASWKGYRIPELLQRTLETDGYYNFVSHPVRLTVQCLESVWLVRAHRIEPCGLTPRELKAALLYGQGLTHKAVARQLNVAPSTVRNFIQNVYQKLNVHDRASLALKLSATPGSLSA